MKDNVMLIGASLLSILFVTFHLTSDTVHARVGTPEAGGSANNANLSDLLPRPHPAPIEP